MAYARSSVRSRLVPRRGKFLMRLSFSLAAFAAATGLPGPAAASELWPQTKLRLTVIHWMPMSGSYERWDAFSGEFVVSEVGAIPLPVIGSVSTAGKSNDQLAGEIAAALKGKLGLVTAPETSIEVIAYPSIYVVGAVSAPGAFNYQPGMNVLQAFALGGGIKVEQNGTSADRLRLVAELRSLEDEMLRGRARIARLSAEIGGSAEIVFPREVTDSPDADRAGAAMNEEQTILEARAREQERQAKSLGELIGLLDLEIETLTTRMSDIEKAIASAEKELAGVESLVAKGLATMSRQSDLERRVADLRFDRLTQTTAILRAQQARSQADRETAQLEDARVTELALDLQEERSKLDQLLLRQVTAQRLMLDMDVAPASVGDQMVQPGYTIVRQSAQGAEELPADETTPLLPGDVLKVVRAVPGASSTHPTAAMHNTELADRQDR